MRHVFPVRRCPHQAGAQSAEQCGGMGLRCQYFGCRQSGGTVFSEYEKRALASIKAQRRERRTP